MVKCRQKMRNKYRPYSQKNFVGLVLTMYAPKNLAQGHKYPISKVKFMLRETEFKVILEDKKIINCSGMHLIVFDYLEVI